MHKDVALKFKKFEDPDLIELAAERIRMVPGVLKIEPLFPGTEHTENKHFYILQVVPVFVEQVLERLKQDPNVEFAHQPAPRTL